MPIDFSRLRREPDFSAPELVAVDATDRLLLDTATAAIRASAPGEVVIIGDRHGALTLGAAALGAEAIRVHQDALLGERALEQNAVRLDIDGARFTHHQLDEGLVARARVVLIQLPGSLEALRETADLLARHVHEQAIIFAGGRVKHMTLRQNDVFREYFERVEAGLARQKSRVLTISVPVPPVGDPPFPTWGDDRDVRVRMAAFGATFGGPTLDHGTRLLLRHVADAAPQARRIVDLGCGNGVVAAEIALRRPTAEIVATDQSQAAVRAAELTVANANVADRVSVVRADATEAIADGWADLILLNPPFHAGHTVHEGIGHRLIRSAKRALRPGGELWVVHNSHLRYRPVIEDAIGETRQVARDHTFTVVAATARSYPGTESAP